MCHCGSMRGDASVRRAGGRSRRFWQDERESASFSGVTFDPDPAAMQLDQFTTEIKPQAHPLFGGRVAGFHLVQPVENPRLFMFGNATAGVVNRYLDQI